MIIKIAHDEIELEDLLELAHKENILVKEVKPIMKRRMLIQYDNSKPYYEYDYWYLVIA